MSLPVDYHANACVTGASHGGTSDVKAWAVQITKLTMRLSFATSPLPRRVADGERMKPSGRSAGSRQCRRR